MIRDAGMANASRLTMLNRAVFMLHRGGCNVKLEYFLSLVFLA